MRAQRRRVLTACVTLSMLLGIAFVAHALPRRPEGRGPNRQRKEPAAAEAYATEIVFSLHPRWREQPLDDLSLTARPDGSVSAVFYDPDGSKVTAAYAGRLRRTEAARLMSRVEAAFKGANRPAPHETDGQITEGDLFYLSARLKDGTAKTMGGKIADVSEGIRGLVRDLGLLWKRLKKTPPADAYVVSKPIAEERFRELQQRGEFRFATVGELPADVRRTVADALDSPGRFHTLSRAQFERLNSLTALVMHGGSGYELHLFKSQSTTAPPKK